MEWSVDFHADFIPEFTELSLSVREEVGSLVSVLRIYGPQLKRPLCDTLAGSKYANMKELRFDADGGVWRVAFAFDPQRRAILLVAGDKSGVSQRRFYRTLISQADARFGNHLAFMKRTELSK